MTRYLLRLGLGMLVTLAGTAMLLAQEPSSESKPPERGDTVVAKGCLDGRTLQSTQTVETGGTGLLSTPLTYRLTGDKKRLNRLRDEQDGHIVEITGILRSTLPVNSTRGKIGNTTIAIGAPAASNHGGGIGQPPSVPVLEVQSFEGAGEACKK